MDWNNEKCVIVLDENLPLGLVANTAAILGITLGKMLPEVVGADVLDRSGKPHLGIIEFPVPVLRGSSEVIRGIREKLYRPEFQELTAVDFSNLAQGCKTYDEFLEKMGAGTGGCAAISGCCHMRREEKGQPTYRQHAAVEIKQANPRPLGRGFIHKITRGPGDTPFCPF